MTEEEARMGFLEHLGELRDTLIRCVVAIMVGFSACLAFSEKVFNFIAAPITKLLPEGSSLIFTGLPDPVFTYIKLSFFSGVILALPYVLFEIWRFVKPGLHHHERKLAVPFIISATLLFYLGAAFAFFLVFPAAFKFFLSFAHAELKPMIAIKEYVTLSMLLMLAFGAVFETPIIIVFLGLLGVFESAALKKGRRYFVVIAFIIAAILTPTPDVVNQCIMAFPMLLFYEVGIIILGMFERRRVAEAALAEPENTDPENLGGNGGEAK